MKSARSSRRRRLGAYLLALSPVAFALGCGGGSGGGAGVAPASAEVTPASRPAASAPAPAASGVASDPAPAGAVRLHGRVTQDGLPVAGAVLIPRLDGSGLVPEALDPGQLFSDDEGRFALDLPPERVVLLAFGPEGGSADLALDLASGAPAQEPELVLAADEAAVLRLLDHGGGQ